MIASRLDAWLLRAFARLDAMPQASAIAVLALACIVANVVFSAAIGWPLRQWGLDPRPGPTPGALLRLGLGWAVALFVVGMPLLETWLLQAFPVFVSRHWTGRPAPTVLFAGVAFAAAHALLSHVGHGATQLGGGLVLGFAWFWASRRPPSPRPVIVTWTVHGLNNLAVVLFVWAVLGPTPR